MFDAKETNYEKVVFIDVFIKTHLEQIFWILSMLCKLFTCYVKQCNIMQCTEICRLRFQYHKFVPVPNVADMSIHHIRLESHENVMVQYISSVRYSLVS